MKHYPQSIRVLATLTFIVIVCSGCGSPAASGDLNTWLGANINTETFTKVDGTHKLSFPIDHGPHEDYLFEWWYLTGILDDQNGREFGVQFTIFRRALTTTNDSSNPWRSGQIYLAHLAVSDVQQETHWAAERFSRAHPELAGAHVDPFRIFVDDWTLASNKPSFFPLELTAGTPQYKVELTINRGKPMILHGTDGYSQKSPEHASYYYTYSSLPTTGTIEVDGQEYVVSGKSWVDREWSSQILSQPYLGWYWFSLVLDDGRELVLFALRSKDSDNKALPTATWIAPDGMSTPVPVENWSIKPRRSWKSYPVEWILELEGIQYAIKAKFDNQVMDTSIRYWEGVVEVTVAEEVVGRGYMELTGYE